MADKFIQTGAIRTRYIEAGEGPALVLIHGSGPGADSWSNWRKTVEALSDQYRVIAYDMVGFGLSDKPDPANYTYSQEARVRQLTDLVEALGLEKVSLIGNSMGGVVTIGACIARPELFDKIVLMGSGGMLMQATPELKAAWSYTPGMDNMRNTLRLLTRDGFEIDEAVVEYRYKISAQPDTIAAFNAIVDWIFDQGTFGYEPEQIASIAHKALIVHGKGDKVVPPAAGWGLANTIPNSWFHLIPDCGHWAMLEQPAEFNMIVRWFLSEA